PPTKNADPLKREREIAVIKRISEYLAEERYRFAHIGDDCIELYLQGKHLTMRMIIYAHNGHLVVRVPEFIRNQNLLFPAFLRTILTVQGEYFDIRFELADDGKSLSACANHILEDNEMTRTQFNQCMTVVAFIVDQHYPLFLKVLYKEHLESGEPMTEDEKKAESGESDSTPTTDPPDGHSLN
ncbi:MAG TPA: hypothetical protein PKO06_11830, partial [Candidatus Ozemobacteraceae bacterium]|nr:hypothetical protein [Candidatus Ozemobacteraceae bacterium]